MLLSQTVFDEMINKLMEKNHFVTTHSVTSTFISQNPLQLKY